MFPVKTFKLSVASIYLTEVADFQDVKLINILTDAEIARQEKLKRSRKNEFITGRLLRNYAFGKQEIKYDFSGTPYITSEHFISISHSGKWVGLADSPLPIALDIEKIDSKAVRVGAKFIGQQEKSWCDTSSEMDMSLLWSFKEVLYKLSPRNGIHFATELLVMKQGGQFLGYLKEQDHWLCYPLSFCLLDGYLLTFNTSTATKQYELP